MGLRQRVMHILRDGHTRRISFHFNGSNGHRISVDRSTFDRVASAIGSNEIHVHTGGVPRRWASYSARDEGDRAANTFYIGRNNFNSMDFAGLIVHESVHASLDLTHSTLPWLDNETAAYIAQGFYLKYAGYNLNRMDGTAMPFFGRMIADDLTDGGNGSGFWMDRMHAALRSSSMYRNYICGTFHGDG